MPTWIEGMSITATARITVLLVLCSFSGCTKRGKPATSSSSEAPSATPESQVADSTPVVSDPAEEDAGKALHILYAGHPGSERERNFVEFLSKHFGTVKTGDLQTFKEADTQGFDVTLLDWDWNEFKGPRPTVSASFSRPVMTLGVPGGLICLQWRLKTGYL